MLYEAYTRLVRDFPGQCTALFGEGLGNFPGLWLAVDTQGFPSFLLAAQPSDPRNDIELRFVGVQFSRQCHVSLADGAAVQGTYTVVRLEENDPDLVRLFLRLLEEAFCTDQSPRTNRAIGERILEIADLFRRVENSPRDIVGLWGELQLICQSSSHEAVARAWCQQQNAKFDFVFDDVVIEVKATERPSRVHRFSLEQLRPPGDVNVVIASMQLVKTQSGTAIYELIEEILSSIRDDDLRNAFLRLCVAKGGQDVYQSNLRFQLLSRDTGIACFEAA